MLYDGGVYAAHVKPPPPERAYVSPPRAPPRSLGKHNSGDRQRQTAIEREDKER